jgi:DNA polymerase-3 subunit epsilon
MTAGTHGDWTTVPIVTLDLEGSGAQDRDSEAILEIAVVPFTAGQPDISAAYSTLVDPGRTIPRRPWISPGLTTAALSIAPSPADIEPELVRRVNRHVIVGHDVGVDWRLLHRRHPAIAPLALIDTLRLARHLKLSAKNSLSDLTAQLQLSSQVERLAADSQPHRALWDIVATALPLPALIARGWPTGVTLATLLETCAIDLATRSCPIQAGTYARDPLRPVGRGAGNGERSARGQRQRRVGVNARSSALAVGTTVIGDDLTVRCLISVRCASPARTSGATRPTGARRSGRCASCASPADHAPPSPGGALDHDHPGR